VLTLGLFGYSVWGGCPLTWTGFSVEAFSGLWDFLKLSAAAGVMLWYSLSLSLFQLSVLVFLICGIFFAAWRIGITKF